MCVCVYIYSNFRKMCIEFLRAQNLQTPWNLPRRVLQITPITPCKESLGINTLRNLTRSTITASRLTNLTKCDASTTNVSATGLSLTTCGLDFDATFNRISSMSHPDLYEDSAASNPFQNSTSSQLALMFAAAASGQNHPAVMGVQAYAQQQQLITLSGGFKRLGDIDDLEREWFERDLKRAQSAPHLRKEEVARFFPS